MCSAKAKATIPGKLGKRNSTNKFDAKNLAPPKSQLNISLLRFCHWMTIGSEKVTLQ